MLSQCAQWSTGGKPVAKGQLRSNKETRKPKKDKSVVKPTAVEGSQVKLAGSTTPVGKKK
jgi:hypothetical protein